MARPESGPVGTQTPPTGHSAQGPKLPILCPDSNARGNLVFLSSATFPGALPLPGQADLHVTRGDQHRHSVPLEGTHKLWQLQRVLPGSLGTGPASTFRLVGRREGRTGSYRAAGGLG